MFLISIPVSYYLMVLVLFLSERFATKKELVRYLIPFFGAKTLIENAWRKLK